MPPTASLTGPYDACAAPVTQGPVPVAEAPVPPLGRVVDQALTLEDLAQQVAVGAGVRADPGGARRSSGRRSARGSHRSACPRSSSSPQTSTRVRSTAAPATCGATSTGATNRLVSRSSSSAGDAGVRGPHLGGVRRDDRALRSPPAGGPRPPAAGRRPAEPRRPHRSRSARPARTSAPAGERSSARRTRGSPRLHHRHGADPGVGQQDRHGLDARRTRARRTSTPGAEELVREVEPPRTRWSGRARVVARRHSMAGQVSITIGTPAAVVRRNASASTTPSWNHTAFAPTATAWSANSPAASERRKTSTTSIGNGTSASVGVALLAQHLAVARRRSAGGSGRSACRAAAAARRWSTPCARGRRTGRPPPRSRARRASGRPTPSRCQSPMPTA